MLLHVPRPTPHCSSALHAAAALAMVVSAGCTTTGSSASAGAPAVPVVTSVAAPVATPVAAPTAAEGLDRFEQQQLFKQLGDIQLHQQLGDEMIVRTLRYAGADDMIIPAYFFAPRDTTSRRPVVLLVHGGIHGAFDLLFAPQVRSLVNQGYVVVAPEYRGSTGYGRAHYEAIDYGGKEVEDVIAALDYLAAFVPYADTSRVGITGRSHGGFIALHAIFRQPGRFDVAVPHVPVSDLPARIRTHSDSYHRQFAEQKGFGARLEDNPRPYVERSPSAHVRKLQTPLLVHAADNDQDVFIVENRILRDSMVAAGKNRDGLYTYREWHDPPGGHAFSRMDTKAGNESWRETVAFLNRYLKHAVPARRGN